MSFRSIFIVSLFLIFGAGPTYIYAQESVKEAEQLDFAQGLLSRGMYDMAILQCRKFISDYPRSTSLQEAYLSLGEAYFLSQDFEKAVDTFSQFKQLYPDSGQLPVSLLRLAQIDIQREKYDEALKELTSIDAQKKLKGPMLQSFDFYTAQVYMGKTDSADALGYFQKATQVQGASAYTADAFKEIGRIHARDGHYSESMDAYTKSMQLAQGDFLKGELTYRIAEVEFLSGRYADAVKGFGQVLDQYSNLGFTQDALANMLLGYFNLGQYDQLLSEYHKNAPKIKEDDTYFAVHFAAARACIELKEYAQANALLDSILAFPALKPQEKAKIFIKKADTLIREGKYKDGLALLDAHSSENINDADEAFFLKAQGYYGLGDFEHAFNFFENVCLNFPGSRFFKAALLGQAHARQKMGRFKESEDLFLKYYNIQDDPDLKSGALYDAAMMASQAGDASGAVSLTQEYLKAFSKSSQRLNSVYFLLGLNQQFLGNSDQALAAYAQVNKHKEEGKFYPAALKNMAIIYLSQKDFDQARINFDRLISRSDQNDLHIETYVWVCNEYLKGQKFDDVLRITAQAEKRFPSQEFPEIKYFKAEALRGLGRCDEAVKNYDLVTASSEKNAYTGSAHIGHGLCLENAKKFDDARQEFQKSLDENPDDYTITAHARFEMANTDASQGNFDDALKFYLLVAAIYDDDYYCQESLLRAAKIDEHRGRLPDALKLYSQILDKYKNSAAARYAKERVRLLK